ncbi:hypothetical protein [Streptomyces longispororuber]|uniref:hypothetical protein n=1 Tax=Streptomyces longispororuber TaxID=68230 RepID=UPI00210C5BA6|nr:hypothetical protein [Streptomyces longispororuber]MCQ4205740.1 hypothetical protein [Streptomyces longispororuber]
MDVIGLLLYSLVTLLPGVTAWINSWAYRNKVKARAEAEAMIALARSQASSNYQLPARSAGKRRKSGRRRA